MLLIRCLCNRLSAMFLVLWLTAFVGVMTVSADERHDGIHVRALDCDFTIPSDYVVHASDGMVSFYSSIRDLKHVGSIELQPNSVPIGPPSPTAKLIETKENGHLQITRYISPENGGALNAINYVTTLKGINEHLTLRGNSAMLADVITSECVKSASPTVLQARKNRSNGCIAVDKERFSAFMNNSRSNPIFSSGKFIGVKVLLRDVQASKKQSLIQYGDLITSFCGVPVSEIMEVDGDICCKAAVGDSVTLEVLREGRTLQVTEMLPASTTRSASGTKSK